MARLSIVGLASLAALLAGCASDESIIRRFDGPPLLLTPSEAYAMDVLNGMDLDEAARRLKALTQ